MAITLFALETTIAQTLGRMETDNLEKASALMGNRRA
jgi:hypothetical protein